MQTKECIGYTEAQAALNAILAAQAKDAQGRPISIAVVDDNGDLVAFARMEKGRAMTADVALKKAYTSVRTNSDSGAFAERMKSQGRSVGDLGDPRMIGVQGGAVIQNGAGMAIGAIGVSGLLSQEDEDLAKLGIKAMNLK